jgi:hypothetical protein
MDNPRHIMRCQLNQEKRVPNASDDVASSVHESLRTGAQPPCHVVTHILWQGLLDGACHVMGCHVIP